MDKFAGPDASKTNKLAWVAIAEDLNAGFGACKTAEQWRRCWIDWKAAVKRQYTVHKKFNMLTDNLPACDGPKLINGLDAEIVAFFTEDTLEGDKGTHEECALQNHKEMVPEYLADEDGDAGLEEFLSNFSGASGQALAEEGPGYSTSGTDDAAVRKPCLRNASKSARTPLRYIALHSELHNAKAEKMDAVIKNQNTTNELLRELITVIRNK